MSGQVIVKLKCLRLLVLRLLINYDICLKTGRPSNVMAKKKAFDGERFISADSRSLGPSPWDARENGTTDEIRSDIRNTRRRNCQFLSVSYQYGLLLRLPEYFSGNVDHRLSLCRLGLFYWHAAR